MAYILHSNQKVFLIFDLALHLLVLFFVNKYKNLLLYIPIALENAGRFVGLPPHSPLIGICITIAIENAFQKTKPVSCVIDY
jgi:hypothetical protein